jgi:hypothetical protein
MMVEDELNEKFAQNDEQELIYRAQRAMNFDMLIFWIGFKKF